MQTLRRPRPEYQELPGLPSPRSPRRKRLSPSILVGLLVTVLITVGAVAFLVLQPRTNSHADGDDNANPNCTLLVPPNPLSAQGLATPYRLVATDDDQGPCHEVNAAQSAFVQGAVIDPATGKIFIYNPLVIDKGSRPAADPVVPRLPRGGIVALWFGFQGDQLTLRGSNGDRLDPTCVNGLRHSVFGQFAYCNAPAFFTAANQAIRAGKLVPPTLGTGRDGKACPTVRDFSVVDQDQSDNLTTMYLSTGRGRTAQATAENIARLRNTQILTNASDNRLLDIGIDGALGCQPWMAPDLADPGQVVPALPLNELQAMVHQGAPVALVPVGDPMVLVNDNTNLDKVNAYRAGVDQPIVSDRQNASTRAYCINLLNIAVKRIFLDAPFTRLSPSPDAAMANSLFTFLAQRFNTTWGADGGLNCQGIVGRKSPIKLKMDDNVTVDARLGGNEDDNNYHNGDNNGDNQHQGNNNNNDNNRGNQRQHNNNNDDNQQHQGNNGNRGNNRGNQQPQNNNGGNNGGNQHQGNNGGNGGNKGDNQQHQGNNGGNQQQHTTGSNTNTNGNGQQNNTIPAQNNQ